MSSKTTSLTKDLIGIENIEKALLNLFDKHRLVFWYDEKQELEDEFAALDLAEIKKIKLENNEFTVKHRLIREEPEQKFLIYSIGPAILTEDNWLLDLVLANTEFKADRVSIQLSELGLDFKFSELIKEHIKFFDSKERTNALKQELAKMEEAHKTVSRLKQRMLAILVGLANEDLSDNSLEAIVENLLAELASDKNDKSRQISRIGLLDFLFQRLNTSYAYNSQNPSISDFGLKLFKTAFIRAIDQSKAETPLNEEAIVLLRRWKNSRLFADSFAKLSQQAAIDLNIEQN